MQISSVSHTPSSFSLNNNSQKGFTLVELLISIGIIAFISSIVLLKYSSFDSTVLLKNAAYEVALALREAQAKSVSGSHQGGDANFPFGVTFTPESKNYTIFRYASATDLSPYYDVSETDPDLASNISTTTMERSMFVTEVCITVSSAEDCGVDRLDVSFRRPEFRALFYADVGGASQTNIQSAKIKVSTPNRENVFVVEVTRLGQISVTSE